MNVAILIPVLNPDEKFVNYINALTEFGFSRIIVVNDGSSSDYDSFFEQAAAHEQCVILKHEKNKGKGRALKTGIEYFMKNLPDMDGIVTGDADGQHTLKDTARLAELVGEHPDSLILGVRDFDSENVPKRSRFGNKTTSAVFHLFHGQKISDTQTGLRGIPAALMPLMLETDGERFEYETNMLVECAARKVPIVEQPIETVYIDDNSSSHFHPVRDSVRVYWLLLRGFIIYLFSGAASFIVDIIIFWLLSSFVFISDSSDLFAGLGATALATVGARVISSIFNFTLNKLFVFKKSGDTGKSTLKYIALVIIIMSMSAGIVWTVNSFLLPGVSKTTIKIFVDALLVIVSYTFQRIWVFRKEPGER